MVLSNEEIIKKMGNMTEEDVKSIEILVRSLEGITNTKTLSLDTLEVLENVEQEISMFRRKYSNRLFRLLKLGFKLQGG